MAKTGAGQKKRIPVKEWAKDHWSLLAYAESRCVDYKGVLDAKHLRCNQKTHPDYFLGGIGETGIGGAHLPWKTEYGTRLHGYFKKPNNAALKLDQHDDWDCLKDIEAAGMLKITWDAKVSVKLTPGGLATSQLLREFKINGGQYADFVLRKDALSLAELLSQRTR